MSQFLASECRLLTPTLLGPQIGAKMDAVLDAITQREAELILVVQRVAHTKRTQFEEHLDEIDAMRGTLDKVGHDVLRATCLCALFGACQRKIHAFRTRLVRCAACDPQVADIPFHAGVNSAASKRRYPRHPKGDIGLLSLSHVQTGSQIKAALALENPYDLLEAAAPLQETVDKQVSRRRANPHRRHTFVVTPQPRDSQQTRYYSRESQTHIAMYHHDRYGIRGLKNSTSNAAWARLSLWTAQD